jgi:DNA-binding winged helix-turn-helix (wHTH) protein
MSPPSASSSLPDPLRFGRFELQRSERRLLIDDRPAPLGARAFDLLRGPGRAARRAGRQERAARSCLARPVVEEGNIAVQVNALRKVLGGELIGTVPGRGYCFTGASKAASGAPATAVPGPTCDAPAA